MWKGIGDDQTPAISRTQDFPIPLARGSVVSLSR
jgi:hypothetical protein